MSTGPFKILQKAFLERTVEHLKPRPAHALPLAASLHDAVRAFEMAHAGSVVILNDELELKGIFTERDLLFKFQPGKELTKIPITSMMSAPVVSIGARASVARVLHLISLGGFRHVPVTAKPGEAPRIISMRDLVDFLYRAVAKDLLAHPGAKGDFNELIVKEFFAASVAVLKPAAPIWISDSASVLEALELMRSRRVGSLLVKNGGGAFLGIFTERDFRVRVVAPGKATTNTRISEVMTSKPICLETTATVALAFKLMSEGGYRNIPVTGKGEAVTGVISTQGLIQALTASVVEEIRQHG